ncbi:MAG TPA: uroporphyrinogen decarboxylase family protein, partial [Candidatus Sulfotelmatobacter sp.]|nr:uroporphyrinogen decarboxylase family protein [Candidatus Sulfotelmatobacter sp.]
ISGQEFFGKPDVMVPAMLDAETRYGLDVASITYDVYNIEAEALGQGIRWTDAGQPDVDRSRPLIERPADLAKIVTPDFRSAHACRRVLAMHSVFTDLTGLPPGLSFCAPFTLATNLRGIEQFLIDLRESPGFARDLLTRVTDDVLAPWIQYQRACFPEARGVTGVDATASLPIVTLEILRDWVVPFILRLREQCGTALQVVNWVGEHQLAHPADMLDLKREVGCGVLWGQDPDVERLGAALYKEYAQTNGLALILGVGAAFLSTATPVEVAARVRQYVTVGRQGGRFALYLCNVGASTPAANLLAAVDAAHSS